MTDTVWTTTRACPARAESGGARSAAAILARFWEARVVTPLHRALDSALLAGELRDVNAGTLADMGYRRD